MKRLSKPKVIKFAASAKHVSMPSPAKSSIPEWYKKAPRFIGNGNKAKVESDANDGNKGLKTCVPFLDAMTTGYVVELWQDVEITRTPDGPHFGWAVKPDVINGRDGKGLETMPRPAGHLQTQFVWINPYIIETPPGYSILITHPLNRQDLPFTTLSGVVDSDGIMGSGHLPFYLREDFEGIIPAGTPIFQVIPFKREDWTSEYDESLELKGEKRMWEGLRVAYGDYKARLWHKKNFD